MKNNVKKSKNRYGVRVFHFRLYNEDKIEMDKNIEILLAKYFSKKLNEVEEKELDAWLFESDEHKKILEQYKKMWDKAASFTQYSDEQVENALLHTKKQMPEFRAKKRYLIWLRQVAAVVILAIGLASVFNYIIQPTTTQCNLALKEVVASPGTSTNLILPDGSKAQLYPGSKLVFPLEFRGDKREVKLYGEAYFKIEHDQEMPFIVKTDHINVKVLGTEFNVRAYDDENYVETVLVRGKVALEKEVNGQTVSLQTLMPNQRSVYSLSTNKMTVTNELDLNKYVGWVNGQLVFDADSMYEVVKKLEKWYSVDIVYGDQLKHFKFTGVFEDESLEEVLTLMQFSSPFTYEILKGTVDDTGKYVRKRIILTKKK